MKIARWRALGVDMFGHDDNQQSTTDTSGLPAAMPDPVNNGSQAANPTDAAQSVGAPAGAPSMAEATAAVAPQVSGASDPLSDGAVTNDDLFSLKQQALQHLSPLVSHLDQTPEEKFRTTMMMIQASDDQTLIKTAFEAAQSITDDKARAQALLDVINEINYFTQHQQQ